MIKIKKAVNILIVILFIFSLANTIIYAQDKSKEAPDTKDTKEVKDTSSQKCSNPDNNPLRKISRGLVNFSLGFAEVPRQMMQVNKKDGDTAGLTFGFLKGMALGTARTFLGLYEVVTFLIPPYKKVMDPEFVFSGDNFIE